MKLVLSVTAVCVATLAGAALYPDILDRGLSWLHPNTARPEAADAGHGMGQPLSATREELARQGVIVGNGGAKVAKIIAEDAYGHGGWPAPSTLGGEFSLVDQFGRPVTQDSFKGKPSVIFFGYAKCDDICPYSVRLMAAALDSMPDKGESINAIFISFDTKFENRADMARFVAKAHPKLIGLTGTRAQIHQVSAKFKVHRDMMPHSMWESPNSPEWRHTSHFYLLSAEGEVVDYLYPTISPEELALEMTSLAAGIMPVPKVVSTTTSGASH